MTISINMYKMTSCYFPVFLVLYGLIFAIICARSIYINSKNFKSNYPHIIVAVCGIVLNTVLFIYPSFLSLSNGGIHMLWEKEDEAIERSGTIEDIIYPSQRIPTYKGEYGDSPLPFGVDITIDGETYFMPYIEEIDEGEKVVFTYLPKSEFILSITTTEEESNFKQ